MPMRDAGFASDTPRRSEPELTGRRAGVNERHAVAKVSSFYRSV